MKNVDLVEGTDFFGLHTGNHVDSDDPHPRYANRRSWTGLSLGVLGLGSFGNSTLSAHRYQADGMSFLRWKFTMGSTATTGTYFALRLPDAVPVASSWQYVGGGMRANASGTRNLLVGYLGSSGSDITVGQGAAASSINDLAAGDVLSGVFIYGY